MKNFLEKKSILTLKKTELLASMSVDVRNQSNIFFRYCALLSSETVKENVDRSMFLGIRQFHYETVFSIDCAPDFDGISTTQFDSKENLFYFDV